MNQSMLRLSARSIVVAFSYFQLTSGTCVTLLSEIRQFFIAHIKSNCIRRIGSEFFDIRMIVSWRCYHLYWYTLKRLYVCVLTDRSRLCLLLCLVESMVEKRHSHSACDDENWDGFTSERRGVAYQRSWSGSYRNFIEICLQYLNNAIE